MTKVDQIIRYINELERGFDRTLLPPPQGRTVLVPTNRYGEKLQSLPAANDNDGLADEPELLVPTDMPIATWLPPDRTKGHVRGYVPNFRTNRAVSYASSLERICAYSLIANAEFDVVEDQPAAVFYQNAKGGKQSHRTDYRFRIRRTGRTIAAAVRPLRLIDKDDLRSTVAQINAGSLDGFADEAFILTERELTYPLVWNSKSILRALRGRNVEHCEWLTDRLKDVNGFIEIRHLIDGLPNALGWNAVFCLIYDGLLQPQRRDVLLPNAPFVAVNRWKLEEVR